MKLVYDSFTGRYSDNPRALYEWLRHRIPAEHVWVADPQHVHTFPTGPATVAPGSAEHVAALESADVVIANTHIDLEWTKRPGATYLQTWHGTPLKRVHRDVRWAPPGRLDRLDRDVARWDYLLSPNAVSTPRLRAAFEFSGEVIESGYPRTDILRSPGAAAVRAQVRAALGLRDDETAVLYTPTWRDQQYFAPDAPPVRLELDLERFVHELGPRFRLLPRLHYLVSSRGVPCSQTGVTDVSSYPDVAELYLAADVLVTDYSSTMFDFAVTGKPMIFYAYDLPAYRDTLRGFYFDFEPVAPGPVVSTSAALVQALSDLSAVGTRYAGPYEEFRRTFCHLDDGRATARLGRRIEAEWRSRSRETSVAPV